MLKSRPFQSLLCLGLGVALGLVAATARFDPLKQAAADPTTLKSAPQEPITDAASCDEGLAKDALLAQAETKKTAAQPATRAASGKKPNIVVIMGDDIGMWNIGAYHRGMMAGKTPHLDKLAKEGMLFTDYYAEASCTAGRAAFITGELPIRTGMTTVGQAGAKIGLPAEACTIATALKDLGYATGQFGKNHLGDLNEFLPTVHGFDEFFGYLYHLDAMEDPAHPGYPQELLNRVGPRNMVHSWATDKDDATVMPRWGKIGKQKIEDAGTLYPEADGDRGRRDPRSLLQVHRQGQGRRQAVLPLAQPDPHAHRHAPLGEVREAAQLEERLVAPGSRHGPARRHRRRRRCRSSRTWAWTTTPSSSSPPTTARRRSPGRTAATRRSRDRKGTIYEGGFRAPAMVRWPGHVPAGTVENGIISGLDWFPTLVAAAGNPNIKEELLKGKKIGDRTYKNHLDSYNQLDMITGKGPSKRHEIYYFGESTLGAVRIDDFKYRFIDQPNGWLGGKVHVDAPTLTNLRSIPSSGSDWPENGTLNGGQGTSHWFQYEFWRFVFVQEEVAKLAKTAIEYPPMQKGASFNLDAVKAKIEEAMKAHAGK